MMLRLLIIKLINQIYTVIIKKIFTYLYNVLN
uniref:Uncharacterized protein n=1 Tax=Anguilla anguilla TaxID=7936 RepID=A0A0E9T6Q0_ANGAN